MAPRFRLLLLLASALVALLAVSSASASEIVTRNAKNVSVKVDSKGHAVVYYTVGGKRSYPVFWGALNARPPTRARAQVKFKRDYSGGYMKLGTPLWKNIKNVCRPYAGPPLAWYVTGCTAPDGSHWVLQSWQRRLPNLGMTPWLAAQRVWELHLSHFTGQPAVLEIYTDYIYWGGLFHHLFGRLTYRGHAVYGSGLQFRRSNRQLRAERLRRHLQLPLCKRLETRERLPLASRRRHLLLRLLSPRRSRPSRPAHADHGGTARPIGRP